MTIFYDTVFGNVDYLRKRNLKTQIKDIDEFQHQFFHTK